MARLIPGAGGSGPVNEGERRVVEALLQRLPDNYGVAPNMEIAEPGGQRFEYDVIVVAPHAVYVVETKEWRGHIQGDDREWLVNGAARRAPILATDRKARVLKSHLVNRAPVLGRVWVEAAVVLAAPPASLNLTPEGRERVFSLDQLIAFLQDAAAVRQAPNSIRALASQVERALTALLRPRTGPLVFGEYEVVESLEQTGDEAWYRARHRLMPDAPAVRLRVVTLPLYTLTPDQQNARRDALKRELGAQLRMGSHPNVAAVRHYFEDDEGRSILVLDDAEGASLRQRLRAGTPMTAQERLAILSDICRALIHAHAHGVIHRLVEPRQIVIGDDGSVRLGHFGLAKFLTNGGGTVWQQDALTDLDIRYLAPEVVIPVYGSPGPATDVFSLGCVAFELFVGHPPFGQPSEAFAGRPALTVDTPPGLKELLDAMLVGDPTRRMGSASEVLSAIQAMGPRERARPATGPKDEYKPGDVVDGKYEVRAVLPRGGFSWVYRVFYSLDDREYALKVFNSAGDYDKLQREFSALRRINHPHVVTAVWADQTRQGQWYLMTEFVDGEPLTEYARPAGSKRLAPEEAVRLVLQLLSALEAIHPNHARIEELRLRKEAGDITSEEFDEWQELQTQGVVHRDIKPQNLMLGPSGIKLIDFNIASRVGEPVGTMSGTPPYAPPDIHPGAESWDVSPDLFATGIVLYELLCYEHPYEGEQPRCDRQPRDPRETVPELSDELAEFLIKACLPYREDRFATAREMRLALAAIDPVLRPAEEPEPVALSGRLRELLQVAPPNTNPLVAELLSLSSQARRSNRGTRGLDDLAEATYISTQLDAALQASVLRGEHRLVIVTGNAGDGKTAFIQQVERAALSAGATVVGQTSNGSLLRYAGREIATLYDGSQDIGDKKSDEVLLGFLQPAMGRRPDRVVRLAAINEGRLRDFLKQHLDQFGDFPRLVIAALDDAESALPSGVVLVNLNLRSVTTGGAESIFSRQLRKIVESPFWAPCERCELQARCPSKHNVDTFRDATSGPAATERLRILVDVVRLRRRRHLTLRDVRSLISHVLFRDRTCGEIATTLASGEAAEILDLAYFQGVGGLGLPEGATLEQGTQLLREIDVALVANPDDDRAIAFGEGPRRLSFGGRASDYPTSLIQTLRERAGTGYEAVTELARRAHAAARRQLYFERADDDWWNMLPYRRLRQFLRALDSSDSGGLEDLRIEVIQAISMYEGITSSDKARAALWLATSDAPADDYRCFRRYPAAEFSLQVPGAVSPYLETQPDHLDLVHLPTGAVLALDVDLVEVLDRLREGYLPTSDGGSAFLINLGLFKNRLLAQPSSELVIIAEQKMLRIARSQVAGSVALEELP